MRRSPSSPAHRCRRRARGASARTGGRPGPAVWGGGTPAPAPQPCLLRTRWWGALTPALGAARTKIKTHAHTPLRARPRVAMARTLPSSPRGRGREGSALHSGAPPPRRSPCLCLRAMRGTAGTLPSLQTQSPPALEPREQGAAAAGRGRSAAAAARPSATPARWGLDASSCFLTQPGS
ncbi:MAG: hypothetical protein J3K34DRAFT_422407 [Monoraphidium minutum]|nr:MAG: hypothetical protein J3K34DRAFT_422407 [Monoraphidium minutum]